MDEDVVLLQDLDTGVVQVKMQDKAHKNTFSPELMRGLGEAFETVKRREDCKVVILTGYDSYFASGGTREALLSLSEGKGKFTDTNLYSLALDCPIPVISAMQGHGVGGGFAMGLFSDIVILSRESLYTTNFMRYGFTPGFGTTLILPRKLGICLAEEMMMSAKNYYGEELQKRGVPFPVLPRSEVMEYALDLARTIAEKPRVSLVTLKDHLVAELREQLPRFVEREVAMHEATFHQPEVRENILALFGK